MKDKLMEVACDPVCGFKVQSHDMKELKGIVKTHAKSAHKMSISDKDVEEKMVEV